MLDRYIVSAAVLGAALAFAPVASAEPDPHIPDGDSNHCLGGIQNQGGGVKYCLGLPYPSGAFYAQGGSFGAGGPFGPWSWHSGASCNILYKGQVMTAGPDLIAADCGGGPAIIR